MTDCFKCKHFEHKHSLETKNPGFCEWKPENVPVWLEWYVSNNDFYHGPRRSIHRYTTDPLHIFLEYDGIGYSSLGVECKTFEAVSEEVYDKRKSEIWYD